MISKSDHKEILVISGPSCAGKTELEKYIRKKFSFFGSSVSATTRDPRPNEVEGEDYYFVSIDTFRDGIRTNQFVEFAEVHACLYGTLKSEFDRLQSIGKYPFFNIDVEGHSRLRGYNQGHFAASILSVFITVPTDDDMLSVLERRMIARGMCPEERKKRLTAAVNEVGRKKEYDVILENPDGCLDETKARFEELIRHYFDCRSTVN